MKLGRPPPGQTLRASASAAPASAAIWAAQRLQFCILRPDAGVQLLRLRDLRVEAVKVRDTGGNKVRLYLPAPAILQGLRLFLRLAPAAADAHRRDVGDSDLNLGLGFDIEWFRG